MKYRNAQDQARLSAGDKISIGWRPEDCRALDARKLDEEHSGHNEHGPQQR